MIYTELSYNKYNHDNDPFRNNELWDKRDDVCNIYRILYEELCICNTLSVEQVYAYNEETI